MVMHFPISSLIFSLETVVSNRPGVSMTCTCLEPMHPVFFLHFFVTDRDKPADLNSSFPRMVFPVALFPTPFFPIRTSLTQSTRRRGRCLIMFYFFYFTFFILRTTGIKDLNRS